MPTNPTINTTSTKAVNILTAPPTAPRKKTVKHRVEGTDGNAVPPKKTHIAETATSLRRTVAETNGGMFCNQREASFTQDETGRPQG